MNFRLQLGAAALAAALLCPQACLCADPAASPAKPGSASASIYEFQPDMSEAELLRFAKDLPEFRKWSKKTGEQAHPVSLNGKADFLYSDAAAAWAKEKGWDPKRFFCIMGRTAAGIYLVSEGTKSAPAGLDMPSVSEKETGLVRKHMGELLKAGSEAQVEEKPRRKLDPGVQRAMDRMNGKPDLPMWNFKPRPGSSAAVKEAAQKADKPAAQAPK